MARVFISYRRSDGQYAVGWIEERLGRLDEVTSVRTAFRDNTLRHGDDLFDALAAEVAHSDVLIAVIGPHWRGERDDGTARILDPGDWVGREIEMALQQDKRIIPVLISGIEPLQAADLLPTQQPLAGLLALRFEDLDDLDVLEHEVREYLAELDQERARVHGLDEPITVPSARPASWVWFAALVAASIAVVVGYLVFPLRWNGEMDGVQREDGNTTWLTLALVEAGVWAFFAVIGVEYFHRVLRGVIELRWRTVVQTGAVALALVSLTVSAFAPGGDGAIPVNIGQAAAAVLLLSPWIVMMLGVSWSRATGPGIREHAQVIAIHRRDLSLATPVVVLALSLSVATTASLVNEGDTGFGAYFSLVSFGVFLTMIVVAALIFSLNGLRHESDLIRGEVVDLAPSYRRHVDDVLVDGSVDVASPLTLVALCPTVVAVGAVVVGVVSEVT